MGHHTSPSSIKNMKSARIVEIFNQDGTITTFPSISSAAKAFARKRNYSSIYTDVAMGKGRIVDIRVPMEVMNAVRKGKFK